MQEGVTYGTLTDPTRRTYLFWSTFVEIRKSRPVEADPIGLEGASKEPHDRPSPHKLHPRSWHAEREGMRK